MDTVVRVKITCRKEDLNSYAVFLRCAEFGYFDAEIEVTCTETGQTKVYFCVSGRANCYGWMHFKSEWERQFGKLHG